MTPFFLYMDFQQESASFQLKSIKDSEQKGNQHEEKDSSYFYGIFMALGALSGCGGNDATEAASESAQTEDEGTGEDEEMQEARKEEEEKKEKEEKKAEKEAEKASKEDKKKLRRNPKQRIPKIKKRLRRKLRQTV